MTIVEGRDPVVTQGPAAQAPVVAQASSAPQTPPVSAGEPAAGASERSTLLLFWEAFSQATALLVKRDFAGAARAYEQALALNPRHEDSLYYLGQCRRELGRPAEAHESFARLVEINPDSVRGHLALGALLASPDPPRPIDLDGAETQFRQAHAINREETGSMVRLGEIAIVRGDIATARSWFESALQTNPKCVEAAFLLGYLHWEEDDRERARADCQRALRAAAAQAPVKGVLSEGDRKAAPPLESPMGTTLFSSFIDAVRRGAASQKAEGATCDLDRLYAPVGNLARQLAARTPRKG